MRIIALSFVMLTLWGCASGPSTSTAEVETLDTDSTLDSIEQMSPIDRIIVKYENDQDESAMQSALIALADDYQQQGNCASSNAVIKYAVPLLSEPIALAKANIIRSECILLDMELAKQSLAPLSSTSAYIQNPYSLVLSWYAMIDESALDDNKLTIDWQYRADIIRAYLLAGQQKYEDALRIALKKSRSESVLKPYLNDFAFDNYAHLSSQQRNSALKKFSELSIFESLLDVVEDNDINETTRQEKLADLVTEFSLNGRLQSLPTQIGRYLRINFEKHQYTAVLLPLSGRLASQGEAIKKGILASYFAQEHEHFFEQDIAEVNEARNANQLLPDTDNIIGQSNVYDEQTESIDNTLNEQDNTLSIESNIESSIGSNIESRFESNDGYNVIPMHDTIVFIDTGSDDYLPETITSQSLQAFDTVIGPLLKPQISAVQSMLSADTVTVHLNQMDSSIASIKQIDANGKNDDELTLELNGVETPQGLGENLGDNLVENIENAEGALSQAPALVSDITNSLVDDQGNALTQLNEPGTVVTNGITDGITEGLTTLETDMTPAIKANYFALSPEQEARELALEMIASDIKHPIIVHKDTRATNRMVEAFMSAWQESTWRETGQNNSKSMPVEVTYTDNKAVRVGITSALDVMQSQQRINQLMNLSSEEVHSVTRNRRDIDAFVVFARPNEIELINPIIESSISFFSGRTIPVYASSYGYNHKYNKNTLRDLRSLIFVDMPFLLPEQREGELASEIDVLLNEPSSTFLRLFAFGYDALSLSRKAEKLRVFQHLNVTGLSGELSIDDSGTVHRKLDKLVINMLN